MKDVKKKQIGTPSDRPTKEVDNPFDHQDADIIWKELLKNSKPVSRDEILKQLQKKKSNRR